MRAVSGRREIVWGIYVEGIAVAGEGGLNYGLTELAGFRVGGYVGHYTAVVQFYIHVVAVFAVGCPAECGAFSVAAHLKILGGFGGFEYTATGCESVVYVEVTGIIVVIAHHHHVGLVIVVDVGDVYGGAAAVFGRHGCGVCHECAVAVVECQYYTFCSFAYIYDVDGAVAIDVRAVNA